MLEKQLEICRKYSVEPLECPDHLRVGIARNVKEGVLPINGLRIVPENGTTGWYLWAGSEIPSDADFFLPLHVNHLDVWSPLIRPYLLLPVGWRFLIAPDYEDVWFEPWTVPSE